ncbi:glycosyltransferase family 39 protein [Candidatus Woesearchaeota archaeon]|nr:glycosyltransferase family 39 protein [Candidatus Woesearchaeota archaeon]
MSFLTIMLFFVYTFGLGFAVTSFVKNSDNFLERNLMRMGFGLALLPFLGLILNLLRIPIDWKVMLVLSLICPLYYLIKNKSQIKPRFAITKTDLSILAMLVIFLINLYIYGSGAFSYPYLEDDDPWSHAMGVKYVSIEKTVFQKTSVGFHYMDPYPPTYELLMGLLHQTNDSVHWTLKFFNALLVSLSIIFFYFFVKEFTQNKNKALLASFALASIPAFMSHFIWSISLTVPLYFVAFYALERIKYDKKWWIVAGLAMVTALTSSPTHSTYFGLFFVFYLLAKMIMERSIMVYHVLAGIAGVFLSFIFWWLPMVLKHGFYGVLTTLGIIAPGRESALGVGGTGDRLYTLSDFLCQPGTNCYNGINAINNPVGIGIVLSALTIIALIFLFLRYKDLLNKENNWLIVAFVWLVFTFYAVNAAKMPIKISPFRAWMLLAIPVCILSAEGAFNLMNVSKKSIGNIGKYAVLVILIIGIYFTSMQPKIAVNTAQWPPGAFWTFNERGQSEELVGYLWLKDNLPKGAKIFTFANNAPIIGFDKFTCHWCEDVNSFQKNGFNKSIDDTYNWLKGKDYGYIVIDGQTARKFGVNETNKKLQDITAFNKFKPVFQNNGMLLFQII